MNFLNPDYLWNLLWIIPAFVFFSAMAYRRRKRQLELILGTRGGNPEFSTLSPGKRMLRTILLGTSIVFLVLAAARPSWGTKILPFSGKGRDLLVVLDVSKSMMSQDVQPSRLGHAKWFLRELIKECPGDRFGIVAFAGTAFLQCPMTADKTTLFQSIDEMTVDSIPLGGTNIQKAIETSLQAFKAAEGGHRAIILVTDGDEVQGSSSDALEDLKKMKIPMFVVGIGDPAQPGLIMLPDKNGKDPQFLRDDKGELVKSPLNETQLKNIAGETSGIYVRSTATSTGLAAIQKRVKALVPEKYDQGNQTRAIERFHIPLFAAVLLLLSFFAVNERRKTPILILLLLSANLAVGDDDIAIPPDKNNPVNAKTIPLAMPDKNDGLNVNPEQPVKGSNYEIYNQALKLQKVKKSEDATRLYETAIAKAGSDSELISKACQNLGVIKHEAARTLINSKPEDALKILDSAEDMYRESMRAVPRTKEVALNQQKLIQDRETAKKVLEQKKQMEQKKQEAQQKTKDAHDSQKEKNQESKSKQDQKQKNDQKKNDQQKQDGKGQTQDKNQEQQDSQKKDDAQKKADEARKAVEDYKKEAQKQESKESEQSASKAEKEIEKAKEEQKKGNGEKAEENLKNAMKELGESEKNDKNKGDEKKEQDKQKQDKGEKNPEKQNGKPQNAQPKDEKEIDPAQADSLLDLMADDEKKLRDEIKDYQRKDSNMRKVDKDY